MDLWVLVLAMVMREQKQRTNVYGNTYILMIRWVYVCVHHYSSGNLLISCRHWMYDTGSRDNNYELYDNDGFGCNDDVHGADLGSALAHDHNSPAPSTACVVVVVDDDGGGAVVGDPSCSCVMVLLGCLVGCPDPPQGSHRHPLMFDLAIITHSQNLLPYHLRCSLTLIHLITRLCEYYLAGVQSLIGLLDQLNFFIF